jgi:SRSO17 transposase
MVTPRRQAVNTVAFIDNYCQHYSHLFEDVRHFEAFKFLHLGILSEIPRKSLPEIAKIVGLKDGQSLDFLQKSKNRECHSERNAV